MAVSKKQTTSILYFSIIDSSTAFYIFLLYKIDLDLTRQSKALGCLTAGYLLHDAHYLRKSRLVVAPLRLVWWDVVTTHSFGNQGDIERIIPNVAKAAGLQSQGAKGEAVVWLLRALGNIGVMFQPYRL